jgi:dihydrofolate reductase
VNLLVYPVLLGKGKRFFAEGTPARALALESTNALPSGIVVNTYKVAGALQHLR